MRASQTATRCAKAAPVLDFDAVIIGAGVSGLYQLYRLRELGLRARILETGSGVGGTWYWNRYPGARFDSESYTYAYSFSQELLEEWNWAERFAGQAETERYLNHVADKFDLRRDIQFNSRVAAASYCEKTRSWDVALEDGRRYGTRFLITAIGVSIILQHLALLVWSRNILAFPQIIQTRTFTFFGAASISRSMS